MNLEARIKYPKVYKKYVNISELNEMEKYCYINRVLTEQLDYNIIINIVNSFSKDNQSSIALNILLFASNYNDYIKLGNDLIINFFNDTDLKQVVFSYNTYPFVEFASIAFEKIFDKLTKEEIEFLLRVPFNKNSYKELEILVSRNVDLDYLFSGDEINEYLLEKYFKLITPSKRFEILMNNKNINFNSLFDMINPEDSLYSAIFDNRMIGNCFVDDVDETIKKFFLKYYSEIINSKDEIKNNLLIVSGYCDINKIIENLNLNENIKKHLISIFKTEKEKYNFLFKYSSEQIVEYILKLNNEELYDIINNKIYYVFRNFYLLPKEKQLEILKIDKELIVFMDESIINDFLSDRNNINNEIIIGLFREDKITIKKMYEKYKFNNEEDCINFLDKIKFFNKTEDYLDLVNKVALKLIGFNSSYKLDSIFIDIDENIKNYPNILKLLSFKDINYSKLLILRDFFHDNKDYLYQVISKGSEGLHYKEDLIKYLEIASIDEINNLKYDTINNIYNYLLSGDIPKNLLDKIFSSKIMKNYYQFITKENIIQYVNLLNKIDESGKLTWLFNQINKKNITNSISDVLLEATSDPVKNAQNTFLKNAITIYSNIDEVYEMYRKNPNLLFTFNFELLNILSMEDIIFFSKYVSLKELNISNLLENKTIIKEYIDYLKEHLKNNKEEIYNILCFFSRMDSKTQRKYFEKFDINDTLYFIYEKQLFSSNEIYVDLLEKVKRSENIEDDLLLNKDFTKEELLNIICTKLLGMSYVSINDFIYEFGNDLNELISGNVLINEDEYNFMKRLYQVKTLFDLDDVNQIKKEYLSKYKLLEKFNYITNIKAKESIRMFYNKEKIDKLYKVNNKYIRNKINGVDILELPNEFNLLVSVVGAYVDSSKLKKHPFDNWNDYTKNINQNICTSLISESNLSFAREKDSVMFGFYNIKEDELIKEAPYDLSSNSNSVIIRTLMKTQCMTTKNMINNTRTGHNEILLKRNISDGKRQPDYIVVVDKIRKKDIKAAKEFNIPIVVINTSKITKYNFKKIKSIINDLEQEIDMNKLEELIILYNNNFSGLITLDSKMINKYYKSINIENYLLNYANKIINLGRFDMIESYIQLLKKEKNKYINIDKSYYPYNFDKLIYYLEKNCSNNLDNNKKIK